VIRVSSSELVLDSRIEEIRKLSPWLAATLREACGTEAAGGLELALVELVTNVIEHGHDGAAGHPVLLRVERAGGLVRIEIRDRGRPIPPDALNDTGDALGFDPDDLDALPTGGIGLALVRAAVDRLDHRPDGEGNLTVIEKDLDPGGRPGTVETGVAP
jgi:serine/threonine-protein kinase RsbW